MPPASTRCAASRPPPRRRWTSRSPPTSSASCSRPRARRRLGAGARWAALRAVGPLRDSGAALVPYARGLRRRARERGRGGRLHPPRHASAAAICSTRTPPAAWSAAEKARQPAQRRASCSPPPIPPSSPMPAGDHRRAPRPAAAARLADARPGTDHRACPTTWRPSSASSQSRAAPKTRSRGMSTQADPPAERPARRLPPHAARRDGVARRMGRRPARATSSERRARHLASARAHGLQGHRAAQRQRHRRGDRGGRRRAQRRHQPGDHRLLSRACSRPTSASRSISWPTSCRSRATPQDELEREREVILQEIAATRDSPDEIAYELLQDAAFPEPGDRPADPRHRARASAASAPPTCAPS